MGFVSSILGILGFCLGLPIGLLLGFLFFVYSKPREVEEPLVRPIHEMDTDSLKEILPHTPIWLKSPDFERIDWLNMFISGMWPYLDKGICATIRSSTKPIFEEYIGKYQIKDIEFESLTLGTLAPTFQGIKVYETNENELLMEPVIKWAGNSSIVLVVSLLSIPIRIQLVDLQVSLSPRICFKPLVPTFPCFGNIMVSLMKKPHVDFGFKVIGGDLMSIPGLYRVVQETIKTQIANLYFWPQSLEIPILDSTIKLTKTKPVGLLHVKVVRAIKLLKMDFLGASDPYVKLRLSGGKLPKKKTTIKMRTLNPEWNENFKFVVNDPETQVLELQVYDWDKVGSHDKLGVQLVPVKLLIPGETKELTLDLLKSTNLNNPHNKKPRGKLVLELCFDLFKYETSFKVNQDDQNHPNDEQKEENEASASGYKTSSTIISRVGSVVATVAGEGVLLVNVIAADGVEGERHTNPYVQVIFRGERRKTKVVKKNRNPRWNEEFQFVIEEVSLSEKIRVEVMSKHRVFGFYSKEPLGYVDITLADVVSNVHVHEKYHLIDSKNGIIQIELEWQTT